MYYVYVLQDRKGSFYLGSTVDLRRRLGQHNRGLNASTRNRAWRLVYYEAYLSKAGMRFREGKLKKHGKAYQALMKRIKESIEQLRCGGDGYHGMIHDWGEVVTR